MRRCSAAGIEVCDTISLSVLLSNLVGLFLLIGVGFAAVRARLLPAAASKPLSALLLKIAVPATVFASMIRPFDPGFVREGITVFLLGCVLFPLYGVLSLPLSRLFRVPEGRRGMWSFCATFCNNGFMGFPVALALFGEEGLALTAILGIPFNLLIYTAGAKMVCMDLPRGAEGGGISWRGAAFSAINLAMVLGVVFYCGQIAVPEVIMTPIQHLSNLTTPLSMLVTGMNLAQGKLGEQVRDRDALTSSLVRLLAFPLLAWALLLCLPVNSALVSGVILVGMAMPAPAVATILGEQYGGCTQLAARTVFLSSLLCIVTIPLVSLLL